MAEIVLKFAYWGIALLYLLVAVVHCFFDKH